MMKRRSQKYHTERGQATMEIAVAAVAIVFLVIGFFTIGGVGITSIKSLILTKHQAERNASQKSFGSGSPSRQITNWSYTTVKFKGNGPSTHFVIPFLAHDEPNKTNSEPGGGYLQNPQPSLSVQPDRTTDPEKADYVWQPFDTFVSRQITAFNTSVLASLHHQAPVLPDNIHSEQNYLFSGKKSNGQAFKQHLRDGGWIDLQKIDITEWESSTMAFPAFAPQK